MSNIIDPGSFNEWEDYIIRIIPIKDIWIAPPYQRELRLDRVQKIVQEFDHRQFDPVKVCPTTDAPNGEPYVCWEGQHHLKAAEEVGHWTVPCHVTEARTIAEQSMLWGRLNSSRTPPKTIEVHRNRCLEGDELALNIDKITQNSGFSLQKGSRDNSISAVAALYWVVRTRQAGVYDLDLLDRTLSLIAAAWWPTHGRETLKDRIIKGTGIFVRRYPDLSVEELVHGLRAVNPIVLLNQVQHMSRGAGSNNHTRFAVELLKAFNRNTGRKMRNRLITRRIEEDSTNS
jgi:hypothetical protein